MTHRYFVTHDRRERAAEVETSEPGRFRVRLEGGAPSVEVTLLDRGTATVVSAGGRVHTLFRAANGEIVEARTRARATVSARSGRATRRGGAAEGDALVVSPMPGRVLKVLVAEGASVSAGTPVVVIEAMKMENELVAARAGVVKRVLVRAGDAVERDAPLLEIA